MQEGRHFGVESRFAGGQRSVQIKDNQALHDPSAWQRTQSQ
jgi:hypothetical protein